MTEIKPKSVSEIKGMDFFIPNYQRGYRWTEQQVKDLLNDINEFKQENNNWYCLQPLVVKDREGRWEVIDGQQRLTTLFIILKFLSESNLYSIEYQTRKDSKYFLNNIDKSKKEENIDYWHMCKAKQTIDEWFEKEKIDRDNFKKKLLNDVKFIWYETNEANPIKVFTRLNIGKIPLTNSELIKALFLNRSNFKEDADYSKIRLRQQEIASQWDNIEYTLQNEEFWLFLHEKGYNNPTRIDFIFDLICKQNKLELKKEEFKGIGNDKDRTFHYFYEYFKSSNNDDYKKCWQEVKKIFRTFNEWYNDLELYHYVGYLIECGEKVDTLLEGWYNSKTKEDFVKDIKEKIKNKIKGCNDLDATYEDKTKCRPLLLLHNIQTVINQNKKQKDSKYGLAAFYKFPFHLYKSEMWDIEHIDPATTNDLDDKKSQEGWLNSFLPYCNDEDLKEKIEDFINNKDKGDFEEISEKVSAEIEKMEGKDDRLSDEEKNQIWNYALLDSSTNRSYGNSIFAYKRECIIKKDEGVDSNIAFVPPCTKNVFLKYYNEQPNNMMAWKRKDAEAYKENIYETLKDFGVTKIEEEKSNEQ